MVDVFQVRFLARSFAAWLTWRPGRQREDARLAAGRQDNSSRLETSSCMLYKPLTSEPVDKSPKLFWADEVRVSPSKQYLYASTRGLDTAERGWVAVFGLLSSGLIASETPLALWETPTCGGWANAVEPAPRPLSTLDGAEGVDYIALTDSEKGLVLVLSWDGKAVEEVARVRLEGGAAAATAVWL
mgnify:FL=1